MPLRGVLFDLDGTIVDVPYDWPRIKAAIGVERSVSILSYLENRPELERARKRAILERFEEEATRRARLRQGVRPLLAHLARRRIRTALVTNNSRSNLEILIARFRLSFDYTSSRESGLWKPSGAPLRAAMAALGLTAEECCAVGDSHFDVQ